MPCIEITEADFDDMHHALGRPDLATLEEGENYRNYFAVEAGSAWAARAEMLGMWDRITQPDARIITYRVNSDGKSALADWLRLQAEERGRTGCQRQGSRDEKGNPMTSKEEKLSKANTLPNYANCPSTHCARAEECRSPSECCVQTIGRRALLPAFRAHCEAMYGGPLPDWPEDPYRWDERFGGLPYRTVMADRFRDFMAGFDAGRTALERSGG